MIIDSDGRTHRPAGSPASSGGQYAEQPAPAAAGALGDSAAESLRIDRANFLGGAARIVRDHFPEARELDVTITVDDEVEKLAAYRAEGDVETRTILLPQSARELIEAFAAEHGGSHLGAKVGGDIGFDAYRLDLDQQGQPDLAFLAHLDEPSGRDLPAPTPFREQPLFDDVAHGPDDSGSSVAFVFERDLGDDFEEIEVDDQGGGHYVAYSAGTELVSIDHHGDPEDHESIESAIREALERSET